MAIIARMTRSSMLEVLGQDYLRTARAKGLEDRLVVIRHALKNALIPIVTAIGLQFGSLISGAFLTETVFGRPGLGRYVVAAIGARDYPAIQGTVLVVAVASSSSTCWSTWPTPRSTPVSTTLRVIG